MTKIRIILPLLLLGWMSSLYAADKSSTEQAVPEIAHDSSDQEIADFYHALDGKFEAWIVNYFQAEDNAYFKTCKQEMENGCKKVEQINQQKPTELEKLTTIVQWYSHQLELLSQIKQRCAYASGNELYKRDGKFEMQSSPTSGNEPALRILQSAKLQIEYIPMLSIDEIVDIYRKVGHSEACDIARNIFSTFAGIQANIRDFTRKHAHFFNQIVRQKDMTVINQAQYDEFLVAFKDFFGSHMEPINDMTQRASQITQETKEHVEQYMAKNDIKRGRANVSFSFDSRTKKTTFEDKKTDDLEITDKQQIKLLVGKMFGIPIKN